MSLPKIVGILNVTPDSFSGDGVLNIQNLEQQIQTMIEQGADVIDVGAESTAPGSQKITVEDELERLEKVFQIVTNKAQFSIDTVNAQTAAAAIDAGFVMVNDVSGGRADADMFFVIAERGVQYVMMYCKNESGRADLEDNQQNVFQNIVDFFDEQTEKAFAAGIKKEQLILDPGMGAFISTKAEDSVEVLNQILELKKRYGLPVYIGASRKGFLSQLATYDFGAKKRTGSSLAVALYAAQQGADFIRVHDVLETRQMLEVYPRISAM